MHRARASTTPSAATLALLLAACGPAGIGATNSGQGPSDDETTAEGPTDSGDTTTSTTSTTTTTTTGPLFVEEGDLPPGACDSFAQDCPEGEKCVPYASSGGNWDALKCVPVMGDQPPGEPCVYGGIVDATDDCDATSTCWDVQLVDDELVGTCYSFCTGAPDAPECPPLSACTISGSGVINICIPTCDPIGQDCGPGLACYWRGGFYCIFTSMNIPTGEPCGYINDCAPGNMCTSAEHTPDCEGSACCTAFCDVNLGDAQCDAVPGTVCVPFFEEGEAIPGYEHVGVCIVPGEP
jgi:hypothetical protein